MNLAKVIEGHSDDRRALIDGDPDTMPEGFEIKGNASSKLYHVPGSSFYNRTKAEVWFASAEDAEAAGFELPKSQRDDAGEETGAASDSTAGSTDDASSSEDGEA